MTFEKYKELDQHIVAQIAAGANVLLHPDTERLCNPHRYYVGGYLQKWWAVLDRRMKSLERSKKILKLENGKWWSL